MAFTNNDLKKLKDLIELHHVSDGWMIKNLIARLEAAEACIAWIDVTDSMVKPVYEAWRKAAGR